MSESRDLAFCVKLFGKTIPVPASDEALPTAAEELRLENLQPSANHMIIEHLDEIDEEDDRIEEDDDELHKDPLNQKKPKSEERKNQTGPEAEGSTDVVICSTINENPKTPPVDKETPAAKALKVDEEQSEGNNSKEKPLKKPDKILPCPRCNSLDTKFCYYNNYNVNQPRHFCKKCQRYWTAGGTMRNVPVGAGRRKNKSSTSQYRQITVSEAIQTSQLNTPELIHRVQLKPNGTVLSFGSDAPLCESMASVLNIAEKPMQSCHSNGFLRQEEPIYPISNCGENGEENSCGSSVTASNSAEEANRANLLDPSKQNCPGFTPQIPCFPGAPWSYPWNPPQWGAAMPPPPSFCASSFPVSFYPATAYWGCTIPGAWSIPWISPPSPHTGSPGSALSSPTLGKHSREGNTLKQSDQEMDEMRKQSNPEKCLWIPKTLRIDDPGEAAKSSIWATLGIKNDKMDASSGGLFKAFESKVEESKHTAGTSQVLHANPAALSRSRNFHESS